MASGASSLRMARLAEGLTLDELSRKVGCHFAHLSRIERGERWPSVELAYRLAEWFAQSEKGTR